MAEPIRINDALGSRALGAIPVGSGRTVFRVWSPLHDRVELVIDGSTRRLDATEGAIYETTATVHPGTRYAYLLDGQGPFPDPCSRAQPDGVKGWSSVVDTAAISPVVPDWRPPGLEELVIYELHIGTFSDQGTFKAIIPRLGDLRRLGVRALELMPVATFPGGRGWGYDGLYTFAPHPAYGTPDDFAQLVADAHAADLGVIVDVVYNHLGPGSEAVTEFGPYLARDATTLWGDTLDYTQEGVREWAIQNAEMWIRDYHADGLRIDAAHAVRDRSNPHVLAELADRVHALNPRALVISEIEIGDLRPVEIWGHDAQWEDSLHHAVHSLVTGERDGYYENFGRVADLARALEHPERHRFVVCAQNHDQVGNRAFGDRLHGARLRLAAFCSLLSPGTPLMFMGEEYDESHPFQYFTDHTDPNIAAATRAGRRAEFSSFNSFSGRDIPDPQSESTFLASKLDPTSGDADTLEYYRLLLQQRTKLRDEPIRAFVDEDRRILKVSRGPVRLAMNFSNVKVDGIAPMSGIVLP